MATYRLVVTTKSKLAPLVSQALFAAGAQGLEERGAGELVTYDSRRASLLSMWQRAESLLRELLPAPQLPSAAFELDRQERWKTAWAEQLEPVKLTPRLVLAPEQRAPEAPRGQRVLLYRPALAFGDGAHATTRLVAAAIEAHYRATPGGRLLDIGTGTGVLSMVAVVSGAHSALGIDVEPEAVRAARYNARRNGLTEQTRFLRSGQRISGNFDLVVANIELRPLLKMLAELPRAAQRAPRLLLTGFLREQVPEVEGSLAALGFSTRRLRSEQGWVLLEARRGRRREIGRATTITRKC